MCITKAPVVKMKCLNWSVAIQRDIMSDIHVSTYFTIMADECTDSANKEQLVLSWVDHKLEVHEDFIGLYNISDIGERAKRARHYQGCTNSSWCSICVYLWRYVCHNSSACHVYVVGGFKYYFLTMCQRVTVVILSVDLSTSDLSDRLVVNLE